MVIKIPKLHDFSDSAAKTDLEEFGCPSVPKWEISVQQKDDIAWSVVLSYLISTNHKCNLSHNMSLPANNTLSNCNYHKNFARRLMQLTGTHKNVKSVKKAIGSFNPFRNRYSCFYNETLKQVVEEFKTKFNWHHLTSVHDKIKAVSASLNCPIVTVWAVENNTKCRIYPKNAKNNQDMIMLYSCDDTSKEAKNTEIVYNFLLNHELGIKMKNAALLYFLRESKMSKKEIRRIMSAVKKGKHFLISLLTNNCQNTVPKLYKSAYVISKLAEAGFETDPRTKDADGLSALCHALILGDANTLDVLYYFAANNCLQSECSYRNPDSCIVNNLHQMEKMLLDDLNSFECLKNHPNYDDFKKKSEDLLGLNKFLLDVNSKIIKIKNKLNYYESANETVFEACKRRDIVVSVLDTYQEYFKPIHQQQSTNISPLDDYIMFKNYYNLIDMATAIIFFDNIVFLKERLVLEDKNQFSEVESSLLFSVMYHVVFERLENSRISIENLESLNKGILNSLYIFPLTRRLENMSKIIEFTNNLRETVIEEGNVVKHIPRSEIHNILNSHPVFKDAVHLDRLKRYLKTAVKMKVTDVKSVLVVERVLQVIGEYLTPEKDNEYSFRRFLSLMLPKEVCRILHQTRNELSHVKSYVFKPKFEYEKNFSLFRLIQKEIRLIQFHFRPVFQTQDAYGCIFFFKIFEKQLEQIREQHHLYGSLSFPPFYNQVEFKLFSSIFPLALLRRYGSVFRDMLKTLLCRVENYIANEIKWSDEWEVLKNNILYELGPLKWTIELLKELGEIKAEIPLKEYEILKTCNQDIDPVSGLKSKTNSFLAKSTDLLSLITSSHKRRMIKPLEEIKGISQFSKILKGFVYLSDEVKDEIRNEIPETIKQSIIVKEKLVKSIDDGFSLKIGEITSEFELSYLSNNKKNLFWKLYRSENREALNILKTPDPVTELEEIFSKSSVDKKKYESLCKTMQFSEQSKKFLGRLVAGQNVKIPGNNLSNLLNRVQLLKKILIEDNGEVFNLWLKVKRSSSRIYIVDKIVWYYSRDRQLQAAVEMLLFDCMSIYENEKSIENPWIKSSKLYCGINMRNVLSHGSPLLESLCLLLDPEDLPSALIQKILHLTEDEDIIKAILELYEQVGNDYPTLLSVINNGEKDRHSDIRNRILKGGDDWKNYALLLPLKKNTKQT